MFNRELVDLGCVDTQKRFLQRIYDGDSLMEACAFVRVNPAVLGAVRDVDVEFDAAIRRAQGFRVEVLVDGLSAVHTVASDAAMAAVMSRNIQWLASKRLREIYGDKVDVNHNVTINIKAAMEDARARALVDVTPNQLNHIVNATDVVSVAQEEIDPLS